MAISRLFVSAAILSVAAYAAVQPVSFKGLKSLHIDGCCGPMVVADFNHDGKPDVGVGGKHGLVVLLGTAKGISRNWREPPGRAGLLGADFNGDGNLDLASIGASDQIEILLGNGDGTFHSAPQVRRGRITNSRRGLQRRRKAGPCRLG